MQPASQSGWRPILVNDNLLLLSPEPLLTAELMKGGYVVKLPAAIISM